MNNFDPDVLFSILPSLPQDYIRIATSGCLEKNFDELLDKLIYLNEVYPHSTVGEKFKVYHCAIQNCSFKNCPFYHNSTDRRRELSKFAYEPKGCFAIYKGGIWYDPEICKKGDKCDYAHNQIEMNFHPKHNQPTSNPEKEEEKNSNVITETVQSLVSEINKCKSENRKLEKEISEKNRKLEETTQNIKEMWRFVLCAACRNDIFGWVLPCGHLLCTACKQIVEKFCPVCGVQVDIVNIFEIQANH